MSASRATQHPLATVVFVAAVAVMLWCMTALSGWITRGQLVHEASQQFLALRHGQPLWQWRLRSPSDLVAGRVFGAADPAPTADGLTITSRDGSLFELGLPLARPVDLSHWPVLRLDLQGTQAGILGLNYQPVEAAPACVAQAAAHLDTTRARWRVDMRQLAWHNADGSACPSPGVVAYMLRLRLTMPAGSKVMLRDLALESPPGTALPPTAIDDQVVDIRLASADNTPDWAPAAVDRDRYRSPIVRLPAGASPEAMLQMRDRVQRFWPAAIVLPSGQAVLASAQTHIPHRIDWTVCGIYMAWLLWLAVRQRPGVVRPWVEVAAIAAGPLWLIAGLRWGPEPSIPGIAAFLAALLYGGQSEWRRRPGMWTWWAQRPAEWLLPLVPLAATVALTLADGHALVAPNPRHVATYVAWAMLQQWAMLVLVLGRLERTGLPMAAIILTTAVLFGLLHTPNGALMQLCLLAELWWAWCFTRAPKLLPIALAHAASALLVEAGLTGHLLRSLEVSSRFFL